MYRMVNYDNMPEGAYTFPYDKFDRKRQVIIPNLEEGDEVDLILVNESLNDWKQEENPISIGKYMCHSKPELWDFNKQNMTGIVYGCYEFQSTKLPKQFKLEHNRIILTDEVKYKLCTKDERERKYHGSYQIVEELKDCFILRYFKVMVVKNPSSPNQKFYYSGRVCADGTLESKIKSLIYWCFDQFEDYESSWKAYDLLSSNNFNYENARDVLDHIMSFADYDCTITAYDLLKILKETTK